MLRAPVIRFSSTSLTQAMRFGQIRTEASRHRKDNWGLQVTDDPESQIEDARRQTIGTLGEWAVANYFGVSYEFTVNSFKAPDVYINGPDGKIWGLQVKASEWGKNFIIRPDAKDWEPYIYCYVELPQEPRDPREYPDKLDPDAYARVHIKGWMFPAEARERARRNPRLVRDPGGRQSPAIFIPVPEILPVTDLRHQMGLGDVGLRRLDP